MISQKILSLFANVTSTPTAHAHCDVPCGIYDPHRAIIGALTVIRMVDIMHELTEHITEAVKTGANDFEFRNNFIRAVGVKEEHAAIVKHEIAVIWGDYFKQDHRSKYGELDGLVHEILQLASKAKQNIDREASIKMLHKVNRFAEIFWETKGKETTRVKAPYKPEEEIIMPVI